MPTRSALPLLLPVVMPLLVTLLLASGCGSSDEDQPVAGGVAPHAKPTHFAVPDREAPWPADLPASRPPESHRPPEGHRPPEEASGLIAAIQVWRLGPAWLKAPVAPTDTTAASLPEGDVLEEVVEGEDEDIVLVGSSALSVRTADPNARFAGMDEVTRIFLTPPFYMQSAVPFSCVTITWPEEAWHVEALQDEDPILRLQALVALVKAKAPRSIREQWETLQGLDALPDAPGVARLLGELQAAFSYPAIEADLRRAPPKDRHDDDYAQQWAARAAGLAQHWEALPRLTELSISDNLGSNLAAERSLAAFPGPEADQALRRCVIGGQYNAWIHAASELLRRDPVLLEETLLLDGPRGEPYQIALFLGRLGNPAAVPRLCAEVAKVARVDTEMFGLIETLARPEHRALVDALPEGVRANQRERAEAVRDAVLARLGPPR